jgi:AraC-like DNA-binding protein
MLFKSKYTQQQVIDLLNSHPEGLMLEKIRQSLGCSEMTLRTLINPLVNDREVLKRNISATDSRPIYLYYSGLEQKIFHTIRMAPGITYTKLREEVFSLKHCEDINNVLDGLLKAGRIEGGIEGYRVPTK